MASNNNNNPLNYTNPNLNQNPFNTNSSYAFTNNILITVTFLLFFLILLLITLHLYFRWYIRHLRRRHLRRQHLIFHFPSDLPPTGLDPSVLHSLPTFIHSSHSNPIIECAVCLSHFEDNEPGRILPKCNHKFHVACIDMWFLSHSTCPLCRALVEFYPGPEANRSVPAEVVVDVVEPGLDDEGRNGRMVCSKEGSVGRLASFKRMLSSETSQ